MDDQKRTCALSGCDRPIWRSNKKYCSHEHKSRAGMRRFRINDQPQHPLYEQRTVLQHRIGLLEQDPSPNMHVDELTGKPWHEIFLEGSRQSLARVQERIDRMEAELAARPEQPAPVPFDPTERLENGRWPQRCGVCGAPLGEWENRFQVFRYPNGDSTYDPNEFAENPQRCAEHRVREEEEAT
jgi:hypothetical protein